MLQIRTTPNLYGITLSGDYLDLNALYDSLSNYLAFYNDNMSEIQPYHEYEYLLSLNYDIRHAYQGDRDTEIVDNNASSIGVMAECLYEIPKSAKKEFQDIRKNFSKGNLYFSVDILYPLVFHYLISFENILEDELMEEWFDDNRDHECQWMNEYTPIDAERDRAKIREFVTLIWENIKSLYGNEKANTIYAYYQSIEYPYVSSLYCNALIHCQLASFPRLAETEKMNFLTLCLYETIDTEDLLQYPKAYENSTRIYNNSLELLKKDKKIFPLKETFFNMLDQETAPGKKMYLQDFEKLLEKEYGSVVDENPEM